MSERKTGATEIPEYIRSAAESLRASALQHARAIVPSGYSVVSNDDLRALAKKAQESPNPTRESEALIDRITALIYSTADKSTT